MSEFNKAVLKVAAQKLRVQRDGKTSEITRLLALLEKEHERGLKGGAGAQAHALRRIETALAEKEAEVAAQCDYWAPVKRRFHARLEAARKKDDTPPRLFPHPDDILIDRREGVRIVGPIDEEELRAYDQRLKMRAALYLQDRIERRDSISAEGQQGRGITSALLLALFLNQHLPPSLRQSKEEQMRQVTACERLSLRDALKVCRSAWKAAGVDFPRGATLRKPAVIIPILRITTDLARESVAATGDPAAQEDALQRAEYRLMTEVPTSPERRTIPVQPRMTESAQ